eukprot:gb/GECG01009764.1/.p1 GENE.gb/GECG01009764.1/~~gb/GECG01009764.1/.p1  ORF type:complete len:435 (+),score=64.66 gb/GECG01009764.1/:1-1305(+)
MSGIYNTTGEPKVLVGNWNEEWRKQEVDAQSKPPGSLSEHKEELKTTTQSQLEAAIHRSSTEIHTRRPRYHRQLKELEKKVMEEVERENEQLHEELTAAPDFNTINRSDFVEHPEEEYTGPKGRRIMKTLDGEEIPPEQRDTEFLASFGLTKPPIRTGKTAEEKAEYLKTVKSTCLDQTIPKDDPIKGQPVTIYSQRLAEGCFPGTEARGANPFARSCTFTNEIQEADRRHAYAQDKPEINRITEMKSSMARAPGSNTSLEPLLDNLRERLYTKWGEEGMDRLERELHRQNHHYTDTASIGMVRKALSRLDVQFPERQLQAAFAYFDLEHEGRAQISDIMEVLRKPEMTLTGSFSASMGSDKTPESRGEETEAELSEDAIRVRVRYIDGNEEVVTLQDTVGISPYDKPAMLAKLRSEGYKNIHSVSLEEDPIIG